MGLVDYASSSEDEDAVSCHAESVSRTVEKQTAGHKRKNGAEHELPPLPAKFHDLYASNVRATTYDDPSLHGGRKRIRPHVEGNWPTHLYIEWWPQAQAMDMLSNLVSSFSSTPHPAKVESLLESELGVPLPLHISLSRSLTLSLSNKASFLSRVQSAISSSAISSFTIKPEKCTWVSNYEGTRWFLVLAVARPVDDQLNLLLQTCNAIAVEFDQPPLYDAVDVEPSTPAISGPSPKEQKVFDRSSAFHISIAWMLTPPSQELIDMAESWSKEEGELLAFEAKDIKCKVGNMVTSIPLTSHKSAKSAKQALFSL